MLDLKDIFLKFLHVIFALGLVYLVVAVFYIDLDTDGVRIMSHSVNNQHAMISGPEPELRISEIRSFANKPYWEMFIDPIYLNLTLPRQYDTVDVVIKYKAEGVPFIQIGAQTSETGWNFAWNGIQNLDFENIDWPCLRDEERNWWLCQRSQNYSSIENFLLGPPRYGRIVNYNFLLPDGFGKLNVVGYNHLVDLENFDYVIAKYEAPNTSGEWTESVSTYSIDSLYQAGRDLRFVISSPGLNSRGQSIQIQSIDFVLHKYPETWASFKQKLKGKLKR